MPRRRKIEGSELEAEIVELTKKGYSSTYIAKVCESKGLSVDYKTIDNYLKRNDLKIKSISYDKSLHKEGTEEVKLNPIVSDVDAVFERFNVAKNSDDIDDVVSATQKLSREIFYLQAAILHDKLDKHSRGEDKHPTEQLRGYRMAFEVFEGAWCYREGVSVAQAIKTLESQGFQIQAQNKGQTSQDG